MRIGIGIDTGGTYTDAAAYDFDTKTVLAGAKALTTRGDLSVGILQALDALPQEYVHAARLISLSTTLATNACVEDRGGSARLIFFGGDPRVIRECGAQYGLPPVQDIYIPDSRTDFSGRVEKEPDWEEFRRQVRAQFRHLDGIGIVELNAMKDNAFLEKKAREIAAEECSAPVVCGHELFSELNSLQRASSTLVNARLFPIIREFLEAIHTALRSRGVDASIRIMQSDGGLMNEAFASRRPVETLLCGPAASVTGGRWLSAEENCLVVDMGGTTTDIALVTGGTPVKASGGVQVGKWRTFVKGLYIKTLGLGGDTAVRYNKSGLYLEDYRIVPLCVAAASYPRILDSLRELAQGEVRHTRPLHEQYMLMRDIAEDERYTQEEQAFCAALRDGPLPCRQAAAAVGRDIYTLDVSRLLREGVVQLCGLTPTDIMHIRGDYRRFSSEASLLAAQYVAANTGLTVEALCETVYDEIKRKLYRSIVLALLENQSPAYMEKGVGPDVLRLIDESYDNRRAGREDGLVAMLFTTRHALVGVGAPIAIFLEDVARMLGTRAVIPEHHEVANALGAVLGNAGAACTVEVKPALSADGADVYVVYGGEQNREFEDLGEAEACAAALAEEAARCEAARRGAQGELTVVCRIDRHDAQADGTAIYLGTSVTAHAQGATGF